MVALQGFRLALTYLGKLKQIHVLDVVFFQYSSSWKLQYSARKWAGQATAQTAFEEVAKERIWQQNLSTYGAARLQPQLRQVTVRNLASVQYHLVLVTRNKKNQQM